MPCRVDSFRCNHCGGEHQYQNECLTNPSKYREGLSGYRASSDTMIQKEAVSKKKKRFNTEGALCDVLSLLEDKKLLRRAGIPQDILNWWNKHQSREQNKIKQEALAKLSDKEKRALKLK